MSVSADGKFQAENPRTLQSVISLWDQETNDQSIQLVLPDTLRPKYYMPDKVGKLERDAARDKRQMERFEFLSRKSVSSGRRRQKFDISTHLSSAYNTSKAERDVDEKLMAPFRNNEKLQEEFLNRVLALKKSKEPEAAVLKRMKQNAVVPLSVRRPSFLESNNFKHKEAIRRRSTLEVQEIEKTEEKIKGMEEKHGAGTDPEAERKQVLRAHRIQISTQWIAIIANLKRTKVFFDLIENRRMLQRLNDLEWRSAVIIQHCWRKVTPGSTFMAVSRQKLHMEGRFKARQVLKERTDACAVIIGFLSADSIGLRAAVRTFIRNVKHCQNIFRQVRVITMHRMSLLGTVLDRTIDVIYHHAGIIFSGKPIQSVDPEKLESGLLANDPFFIRYMFNIDFHARLRNMQSSNEGVFAVLKSSRREKMAGKWLADPTIKEEVLRRLLARKRQSHLVRIKTQHVPRTELPKMSETDVRSFIQTGKDPLATHVQEMEDAPMRIKEMLRVMTTKKKTKGKPFLMLRSITADEMVACAFEVIERSGDMKKRKVASVMKEVQKQRAVAEYIVQNAEKKKKGSSIANIAPGPNKRSYNRSISALSTTEVLSNAVSSPKKLLQRTHTNMKEGSESSFSTKIMKRMGSNASEVTEEEDYFSVDMNESSSILSDMEMRPATPPKSQKPSSTRPSRRI